jgi:hypothetical protein
MEAHAPEPQPKLSSRTKTILALFACLVTALSSAYFALWFVASSSLACVACNCDYSLFSERLRCRVPFITALASIACLATSVALGALGYHLSRPGVKGDA